MSSILHMMRYVRLFNFTLAVFGVIQLISCSQNFSISWTFWTLFTSYSFFCVSSSFHETAHRTLEHGRRRDLLWGRLLGTLMHVSYTCYLQTHIRHHSDLLRPTDWELWPYAQTQYSGRFRRVFVWTDILLGGITSPWIYSRIYFSSQSPLRGKRVILRGIRIEYGMILGFWTGIWGYVAYVGSWGTFSRAWLIPYFLAGIMQSIRKLTEHLGMNEFAPLLGTRTVQSKNKITRIFSLLNSHIFNHGPHHAGYHWGESVQETYPAFSSYRKAVLAMFPHLLRNPGVGLNSIEGR